MGEKKQLHIFTYWGWWKKIVLEIYGDEFKRKFKLFIDVIEDRSISMKMKNTYHRNVLE